MTRPTESIAELGIDGDHAVALHGPDHVVGTAVWVQVRPIPGGTQQQAEERAAFEALRQLEAKLGRPLKPVWGGHWPRPTVTD